MSPPVARPGFLFLFFPLLLVLIPAFSTHAAAGLTAYEVLESYGLPVGLLPQGALGYDLDRSTGRFAAYLNGSCSFSLEGAYQLKYKPTITGRISNGRLQDLKGVTVKILFIWVGIVDVSRRGDDLEFSVGIASAGFGIENFYECPQCGCGINCPKTMGPAILPGGRLAPADVEEGRAVD